jgi:hypothetical protein
MNAILSDFLWRWRWAYVALAAFHLFLTLLGILGNQPESVLRLGLGFVGFSGSLLLAIDLRNGIARPLLALPIEARAMGRAFWLLAVGIPVTLGLTILLLARAFAAGIHRYPAPALSQEAIEALYLIAYTGTVYFLLSLMPPGPETGLWRSLRGGLVGAAWGGSLGFSTMIMGQIPLEWGRIPHWHWVGLVGGCALAVLGWFRGELVLRTRARRLLQAQESQPGTARVKYRASRSTGSSYLWWNVIRESCVASIILVTLVACFEWVVNGTLSGGRLSHGTSSFSFFLHFQFSGMLCLVFGVRWVASLRSFRVLPQSTWSLSLQTFAIPLVPWILYWTLQIAASAALQGELAIDSRMLVAPVALGMMSLSGPVLVRLGVTSLPLVLVGVLSVGAPIILLAPIAQHLDWPGSLALGAVLAVSGYTLCLRTLTSPNGVAYRGLNLGFARGI